MPGGFPGGPPDELSGLTKLPSAPPPGAGGPAGDDDEAVGEDWFAGGGGDSSGKEGGGGGEAGNGEPAAKKPNVQYGATGLKQASTSLFPSNSENVPNSDCHANFRTRCSGHPVVG